MNRRRTYKLLIVALVTFCTVFTGCMGGGGSGGGGNEPSTPTVSKHEITVLSTSTDSVDLGNDVVVTVGVKTVSAIDACGYQFALEYDNQYFDLKSDLGINKIDGLTATYGDDSDNGVVRVVAVPSTQNGTGIIDNADGHELFQLTFTARATGNGLFQLSDTRDFPCSIFVIDDGNPIEINKLNIITTGKTVSVN